MKKIVRICYLSILVPLGLYLIIGLLVGKNKIVSHVEQTAQIELYPDSALALDEDTVEYQFTLEQPSENGMALRFLSSHQTVFVFADGALVYSLEAIPSIYGISPGTTINMVELPTNTTDLLVRLRVCIRQQEMQTAFSIMEMGLQCIDPSSQVL